MNCDNPGLGWARNSFGVVITTVTVTVRCDDGDGQNVISLDGRQLGGAGQIAHFLGRGE